MKKMLALLLALSLLLCGCAGAETPPTTEAPAETVTEPTAEPTEEPTVAPTTEPAPVYTNPLTGEELDAPVDNRIFAVSINNLVYAVPHHGVQEADIFMEMFVNGSIIRGLALYTDPTQLSSIGSVRSTRYMFTDIALHYDAIVAHAGGSQWVLADVAARGADGFNIDTADETYYSFRHKGRIKEGFGWEHCLFANGTGLMEKAAEKGIETAQDPEKDYGLIFTEDGTPAEGETADSITVTFTSFGRKASTMAYDAELGKYVYWQYDQMMVDGDTKEPETFENVVIMLADIRMNAHAYHEADFVKGGEGYFACGGKIIPILWTCDGEDQPFRFTTVDGEPLAFGVGNSYIAIAPNGSPVEYA